MPEGKTTIEELHSVVTKFRSDFEEFKTKAVLSPGDWAEKEKKYLDAVEKAQKRLDDIETKLARPIVGDLGQSNKETSAEHKALMGWIRTGTIGPEDHKVLRREVGPGEKKVLTIGDSTQTGYLVSPEITNELIKGVVEYSPLRSVARVRQTSKTEVWVRKRTGTFSATRVAEIGTKIETTGYKVGLEKIPTHEYYALVNISNWDLEDSDFDLEGEMNQEFNEQFGVAEGYDFILGNGVTRPEGILVNTTVLADAVAGDTAGDLSVTDVLNTYYTLAELYANNASWLLRRATMQKIVLFKDSANHYIWMPSLVVGQPNTILGRPIIQCPDMPAVAASAYALAFGDFRRGYYIVDRIAVEILRDPYTSKKSGQIEISARKRIGGQVVLAEAIQLCRCHA